MYERLIALTADGKPVPYLAKAWKISPGKVTLTIRTDATCSDGARLTSDAFAGSLKAFFSSKSAAVSAFGPGPYNVTADDQQTVTVSVGSPLTDLFLPFADPRSAIVCPAGLKPGADFLRSSFGSGPFSLVSATHGDSAVMKLRADWAGGPNGTKASDLPDTLIYRVVDSDTTAANLLLTGGLDVAYINGPDVNRLNTTKDLIHRVAYPAFMQTLLLNEAPGHPTADPNVRAALTYLTDRNGYGQAAYAQPATSFIGPVAQCYDASTKSLLPQVNKTKAISLLADSGYTVGSDGKLQKDGKHLQLTVVGRTENGAGPEYLGDLYSAVGIDTKVVKTDLPTWIKNWRSGNFDAMVYSPASPIPTPNVGIQFYIGPFPPAGTNYQRTSNATAEAALVQARSAVGADVCKSWATIQQSLLQAHDYIPLVAVEQNWYGRKVNFQAGTLYLDPITFRRQP
jgi:peptide/nickel transport system substrate-binding protein